MRQQEGRGKPPCLTPVADLPSPHKLGCFLAVQPPADSGPPRCLGTPPSLPPACTHHLRCRKGDGNILGFAVPSGPGLARDLVCQSVPGAMCCALNKISPLILGRQAL